MDMEKNYPFEFSVIMAVYNVEPFIREAVDSLIAQDFGFEIIQLVMVDDGSTDGSGLICDEYAEKYPNNVLVVHKENGGLSSARNAGVKVSTGRYLNFFDPDDILDPNVFSSVYQFFQAHENETDIISIPLLLFGNQEGEHPANNKFMQGDRVINLEKEWMYFQMSLASAFIKSDAAKEICFHEDLTMVDAEDGKEILKILIQKPQLGVVIEGKYHYRKHGNSQVTRSVQSPFGYIPYLQDYSLWAFQYAKKQCGRVPKFVQNMIMYHLQWKIKDSKLPVAILGEDKAAEYSALLKRLFAYIDDDVIMAQANLYPEHKAWILEQKYGKPLQLIPSEGDALLAMDQTVHFFPAETSVFLEFFKLRDGLCELEGYGVIFPVHLQDVRVEVEVNGRRYPCESVERGYSFALDEPISRRVGFRVVFPIAGDEERYVVKVFLVINGFQVESRNLRTGLFFPVTPNYENSYFILDGWRVSMDNASLAISPCERMEQSVSELKFLKELWRKNRLGARKAVFGRVAYHALKRLKRKPLWLISDRINKADDNGEAFFRYMQAEHKGEIKSCFVISKNSADYPRMKKLGPVVDNLAWRHKLLFLLCDFNISAQADKITNDPFPGYEDGVRDILSRKKFVFLQHGITKDDVSNWLNRYSQNFYGFVTAAYPEYQSILEGPYYYGEKQVWLTGFPRFDRRYHDEKKNITIMPTWRVYLLGLANQNTGLRELKPGFRTSAYFTFYQGLLSNPRLIASAEKQGYRLRFFSHPNLQHHMSEFKVDPAIEVLGIDTIYNEVYAESDLVVTDYSSAVFDFAYLRKPLIYCQFDKEEFFAGEHVYTKGYFDYERDGFGEVEYDLESTVDRIIEYMENGCQLKEKYRERIDQFFAFNDRNNCQRVYERIIALNRGDACDPKA